ncbi:MAG: F0F1 ATP synthase subunit B [Candidatus Margulisiibacteriota bacterium]
MLEINGTIAAVILNFLILAWILEHFLYKPVRDAIEQRKKTAENLIGESEKKLAEADQLKASYESRINDAQKRSKEIVDSAIVASQNIQKDVMDAARKDSGLVIDQARKEAEKIRLDAYSQARRSIASLVCLAAGRLMMKKLDEPSDRVLVEEMINNLEKTEIN